MSIIRYSEIKENEFQTAMKMFYIKFFSQYEQFDFKIPTKQEEKIGILLLYWL